MNQTEKETVIKQNKKQKLADKTLQESVLPVIKKEILFYKTANAFATNIILQTQKKIYVLLIKT